MLRARHLLPAAGRARGERKHPRAEHRRPLPGALAHLQLRRGRRAKALYLLGRHDDPQHAKARRGRLSDLRAAIRARINHILEVYFSDTAKARELKSDGNYERLAHEDGAVNAQEQFMLEALENHVREKPAGESRWHRFWRLRVTRWYRAPDHQRGLTPRGRPRRARPYPTRSTPWRPSIHPGDGGIPPSLFAPQNLTRAPA